MVPCTGWLLRTRRKVLAAAVGLWLGGVGAVFYCMQWFARQPYSVPFPLWPKRFSSLPVKLFYSMMVLNQIGAELLCLLLVMFPVLVAWLGELGLGRRVRRYVALFCASLVPLIAVKAVLGPLGELWPPHMLFKELSTRKDAGMRWHLDIQRSLLPFPARLVISCVVLCALYGCLIAARRRGGKEIGAGQVKARELFWLCVPYFAAYVVLLLPSAFLGATFDRYALGIIPCAITGSLWLHQRCVREKMPAVSIVFLIFFGAFSVAGTHDWFAWQRARLAAISELRGAGVPRTAIQGGFEYDGWTQVEDGGHLNNPAIRVPGGVFDRSSLPVRVSRRCLVLFGIDVPRIHPEYSVAVGRRSCYLPSRFKAVHYTAWLPPFRRTIEVQRVPGGGAGG
jgi:hypothetical protein